MTFKTSEWLTEVKIKAVETGYRWVLTYHLFKDPTGDPIKNPQDVCPSASAMNAQIKRLTRTLSSWESLQSPPAFLAYPLAHQYTLRSLSLASLKGIDYFHALYLVNGCAQHGGFYAFLAQINMHELVECEFDDGSRENRRQYLHRIFDLEGTELYPIKDSPSEKETELYPMKDSQSEKELEKTSLLRPINYSERAADSRVGGGYMGNQHADVEEVYSDVVSILQPRRYGKINMALLTFVPSHNS